MACLKLLYYSNLFAIAGGRQYQPLAVAYKKSENQNDSYKVLKVLSSNNR